MNKQDRHLLLDLFRGTIMIFMALDHANAFIAQKHSSGEFWGGPFPQFPNALSFLTRFITHFSAPGFFFLMGVGMYLFAENRKKLGWSSTRIIVHFIIRGSLLITFQFLLENRAWALQSGGPPASYYGVLFALGSAMISSAVTLNIPTSWILALSALLFVGTEVAVPAPALFSQFDHFPNLINFLLLPTRRGNVLYPILPWLELVLFGVVFGKWIAQDPQKAFRRAARIGWGFLGLFLILRMGDGFGNIRPRAGDTWMDFFNLVKYPPSWTFTLLTTGVNLLVIAGLSNMAIRTHKLLEPIITFGQVPLFFYIFHLFSYAWIGKIYFPSGTSILQMYPYWILGLIILYPLCLGFKKLRGNPRLKPILQYF